MCELNQVMLLNLLSDALHHTSVDETGNKVASIAHIELQESLRMIHFLHNYATDLDSEGLAHDREACHFPHSTFSQLTLMWVMFFDSRTRLRV